MLTIHSLAAYALRYVSEDIVVLTPELFPPFLAPEIATTICQSGILKDSYREAAVQHGALFTFPSKKTRIDFIFVKHATVLSTRTIVSSLSDHYPLVIVVEI